MAAEGHVPQGKCAARCVPEYCGDGAVARIEDCGNMCIILEKDDLTASALFPEAVECGAREDGICRGPRQILMLDPRSEEIDRRGRLC